MKVLALFNLKGGVGKTTAAVHLAHLLADAGRATLLWDLDPQGAASWYYRVRVERNGDARRLLREREVLWASIRGSDWPNLDVLPSDLSLPALERVLRREDDPAAAFRAALADLGSRYERIVLDCPPGLSTLSESVFRSCDALLVPTIPTPLSLRTLAVLNQHLKEQRRAGLRVMAFFSMLDPRKAMHRRVRDFARAQALGFLAAEIPHSARIEASAARREPLTVSPGAAGEPYRALAAEVEERLAELVPRPPPRRSALLDLVRGLEAES